MQLNIKKLDERIQKLQEIKRIAADPELVAMLLEFIAVDEAAPSAATAPKPLAINIPRPDDFDIVNQVMNGLEGQGIGARPAKRV
ncbi:MAG: hypothetical protein WBY44_26725 [Bryobacteraceae bacterium]|jgi:hypothetical protein